MRYDHKFMITSEVIQNQLYLKVQRSNGYLLIHKDYWNKLAVSKRKTIINKWRRA